MLKDRIILRCKIIFDVKYFTHSMTAYNSASIYQTIPQNGGGSEPAATTGGADAGTGGAGKEEKTGEEAAGEGDSTNQSTDNANTGGAENNNAAAAGSTDTGTPADTGSGAKGGIPDDAAAKAIADKAREALLAELGVKSLDELTKKPAPAETDDQRIAREKKERDAIIQYGLKNDRFSLDELGRWEAMKTQDKVELAMTDFAKSYKELHKDRLDDEQNPFPVTPQEIQDEFNNLFHIDSSNPALKAQGEKFLDFYTKNVLGDTESKYNQTAEDWREYNAMNTYYPEYKTFVTGLADTLPAQIEIGEGDNKIVLDTTKLDKAGIATEFAKSNDLYKYFYDAKGEPKVREAFQKDFQNKLITKHLNSVIAVAIGVGESKGTKNGSSTGAVASFKDKDGIATSDTGQKSAAQLQEDYAKEQRRFYGGRR
jgi:hypothetical protein